MSTKTFEDLDQQIFESFFSVLMKSSIDQDIVENLKKNMKEEKILSHEDIIKIIKKE